MTPPRSADLQIKLHVKDVGEGAWAVSADIQNAGPTDAWEVIVKFTLPTGTAFDPRYCTGICYLADLGRGQAASAGALVQFPQGGPFRVRAEVLSEDSDPHPANNSETTVVAPQPEAARRLASRARRVHVLGAELADRGPGADRCPGSLHDHRRELRRADGHDDLDRDACERRLGDATRDGLASTYGTRDTGKRHGVRPFRAAHTRRGSRPPAS